jgi:TrmH family RNA methyltransferase
MRIESVHNPRVKRVLNLQQKSKLRRQEGVFVVEGRREVERALVSGFDAEEIWSVLDNLEGLLLSDSVIKISCSQSVFDKITYRESSADILAVFKIKSQQLEDIALPQNPLIVVLEAIEKPGNIGAVLRTCNALGADAVFLCDSLVDLYNPNVIRNSLGGFFGIPIISTTSEKAIAFFKERTIEIVTTHLEASVSYLENDFTKPTAIVLGTEASGLTDVWVKSTSQNVIIEMGGVVDSLNISVAGAIVLSEAIRQRKS